MMLVRPEPKVVEKSDIAARAHARFVARGGQPGRAMETELHAST